MTSPPSASTRQFTASSPFNQIRNPLDGPTSRPHPIRANSTLYAPNFHVPPSILHTHLHPRAFAAHSFTHAAHPLPPLVPAPTAPKVDAPVARGLAMGASGHGLGTAAMSGEVNAFPFAAIAMATNAAVSTVLVTLPFTRKLLRRLAGV